MISQRIFVLIFLSVFSSSTASARQKVRNFDYNLCEVRDLPVSVPSSELGQPFLSNLFISSKLKDSFGMVTFKNLFGSPIEAIELVLEYQGENGQVVVQLPYVGLTPSVKQIFPLLMPSEYKTNLKRRVTVGSSVELTTEGFVVVPQCPSKARAIALKVQFSDGKSQTWTSPNWHVKPLLKYFPADLEFPRGIGTTTRLLIRAEITPQGKVAGMELIQGNAPENVGALLAALKEWDFHPARVNGEAVTSDVVLLVRFNRLERQREKMWDLVLPEDLPIPLSVVDLVQDPSAPTKWKLWYGRRPGGTRLE